MNPPSVAPVARPPVPPIPAGFRTVTPYLVCADASAAIDFYKAAFGANELMRVPTPEGRLMYAAVQIGDSMVMLNDEFAEMGSLGPKARGGASVTLHLFVEDVDAAFARAVAAGAKVLMPVADMFWGDRFGLLEDPFGHSWSIGTHQKEMTAEEIAAAARGAC